MPDLTYIEELTVNYAEARGKLVERVRLLQNVIERMKQRHLGDIVVLVGEAGGSRDLLHAAIEDNRELFAKPKTATFNGIRVGLQKQKGEVCIENKDQTLKLIKKHFPEQEDLLIKTTETLIKIMLANLSGAELKKIGVEIKDAGEKVLIKETDTEIEKFVAGLLKEEGDGDQGSGARD